MSTRASRFAPRTPSLRGECASGVLVHMPVRMSVHKRSDPQRFLRREFVSWDDYIQRKDVCCQRPGPDPGRKRGWALLWWSGCWLLPGSPRLSPQEWQGFWQRKFSLCFPPCPGAPHATFQVGGAIYIEGGTLVVHDSAFESNTASVVSE